MKGRKPTIGAAPDAITETPPAPDWMSEDARSIWDTIMPRLLQRGALGAADLGMVENYCLAGALVRRSERQLAADGDVYKPGNNQIKRHPASQIMNQAMNEQRRLAAELGLSPASRARKSAALAPSRGGAPSDQGEFNLGDDDDPYASLGIDGARH